MEDYLLIIDGSSLLTTQFFGNLPREILFAKELSEKEKYFHKIMMTSKGVYTNAVFGFLRTLFKILKDQKPAYLAVCWDLTRDTFRRKLYPDYKGNRSETLVPLSNQFALMQDVLAKMGVKQFMSMEYEADDFCGSLSTKFEGEIPVKIFTKDHDYLQLVTEKTHMWLMHSSADQTVKMYEKYHMEHPISVPERAFELTPELVLEEFGVDACNVNSLKGIEGDPSDNIKGVLGVGHDTAVKLIYKYKTVDELYKVIHAAEGDGADEKARAAGLDALKAKWKDELDLKRSPLAYLLKESENELVGEKAARLSEILATIKKDIDFSDVSLADLQVSLNRNAVEEVLDSLEFKSIPVDFLDNVEPEKPIRELFREVTDFGEVDSILKQIKAGMRVGLAYEPGVGLAVMWNEAEVVLIREMFFVTSDVLKDFCRRLADMGAHMFVLDGKSMIKFCGKSFDDVALMAYLLDPISNNYSASEIAKKYLNFHQAVEASENVYLNAYVAFEASDVLCKKLADTGMFELYQSMELPLERVLSDMEIEGIMVDSDALKEYSAVLKKKVDELEQEIFDLAGFSFNINSPKQLGEALFEKLAIPYPKKTKNGYSTAAEILEELADDYPIVAKVLNYRTYAKLRSTYAEGLQEYIQIDSRIHCNFNQMVTATGRISSDSPNLQNIPMRTEEGRLIRKVFVAKPGSVFIDADYSQIELRILAHLSEDENLILAYKNAKDIHAKTASLIFNVPLEEVTSEMRRKAKIVNFGIIYGMSAFSLSKDLGVSRKEAESFMDAYFNSYPSIQKYLKDQVAFGYENGYVKTAFNRVRPVPELESSNFNQRSFGERVAMNSPIQGTAADIMKLAMIRMHQALIDHGLKSKIVLQVHDELIIEALESEADLVAELLRDSMEHAADLSVNLDVELNRGFNLYESK